MSDSELDPTLTDIDPAMAFVTHLSDYSEDSPPPSAANDGDCDECPCNPMAGISNYNVVRLVPPPAKHVTCSPCECSLSSTCLNIT